MGGLLIHTVTYLSVNGLLFLVWLMGTGNADELDRYRADPSAAITPSFWPLIVAAAWGVALLIHAAAVAAGAPGRHRRRRDRTDRRARRRAPRHDGRDDGARPAGAPSPPAPPATRHWTVVMFTDIARSTPLAEALGDEAWAGVLADHRRTVRELLDVHDGREVSTQGDGFLVTFDQPQAAVTTAVALQRTLAERRPADDVVPHVRIGVHAGEAVGDGDGDLVGHTVNLAARVVEEARPDEILVTEPVADHLDTSVRLVDRGLHHLKGVSRPRHLLAVVWQPEPTEPVDLRGPEPDATAGAAAQDPPSADDADSNG